MNAQWRSFVDGAGWTLLHFVWQGTLAALGLGFALAIVPRTWARVRYVLACLTLIAMAALPAVTASYVVRHPAETDRLLFAVGNAAQGNSAQGNTAQGNILQGDGPVSSARRSSRDTSSPSRSGEATRPRDRNAALGGATQRPLSAWFPWLVAIWLAGVCICSIRLAGGWWHTRRLIREDAFEADAAWVRVVEQLATRLRLPLRCGCSSPPASRCRSSSDR